MRNRLIIATFFGTVLLGSAGISYAAFSQREPLRQQITESGFSSYMQSAAAAVGVYKEKVQFTGDLVSTTASYNWDRLQDWAVSVPEHLQLRIRERLQSHMTAAEPVVVPISASKMTLSDMQARQNGGLSGDLSLLEPASGAEPPPTLSQSRWTVDKDDLSVEAVLVPRQVTVISSSQDGKIANVFFGHGDHFKKGDTLIAYDCDDLEAEAAIAGMEKDLTAKKNEGGDKLFKLDIISDVDRLGIQIEDKQAASKVKVYKARMNDCRITAQFDGTVTNRLANPGEYTRTDRVLMEVASDEPLQVEFMVPSKWLRWVNTGAPLEVKINETDAAYSAKITRIYGEVDPVSQSIQMVAALDTYKDPLLPGMSGQAKLSVSQIEKAGIRVYLQAPAGP